MPTRTRQHRLHAALPWCKSKVPQLLQLCRALSPVLKSQLEGMRQTLNTCLHWLSCAHRRASCEEQQAVQPPGHADARASCGRAATMEWQQLFISWCCTCCAQHGAAVPGRQLHRRRLAAAGASVCLAPAIRFKHRAASIRLLAACSTASASCCVSSACSWPRLLRCGCRRRCCA